MDIHCRLESCMNFIASANHQNCTHWRMMADLFRVKGASSNEALKCLAEDRVERLLHIKEE